MLTQKEAALCLLAISVIITGRLIRESQDEEVTSDYEMNNEQWEANFFALWDMMPITDKDALTKKLQSVT